jgi:hypothetical protein
MSASDALGSFTLTNTTPTGSIGLRTNSGNNAWELYIPRTSAEPLSSYFDVGLGQPFTGPTQGSPPIPPDGTVNTSSLSYFPTTLPPGIVGYSQFATVNDPADRFSYVYLQINSLGPAVPEPATIGIIALALAAGVITRRTLRT